MLKEIVIKDFFAFNGEHHILLNSGINLLLGINGSGKTSLINALTFLFEGVCGSGLAELIRKWGSYNAIINARGDNRPECFSLTFIFDAELLKNKFPKSPFLTDIYYKITVFPLGDGSNYTICESLYSQNAKNTHSTYSYIEFRNGVGTISARDEDGSISQENYDKGMLSAQELSLRQINAPQRYLPAYIIREAVTSMAIYGKFNIDMVRRPSEANNSKRLIRTGENIAYLYNTLNNNHSLHYEKIIKNLNNINPNYTGIGYNFFGNRLYLNLRESNLSHTIDTLHISDGTLKYMLLMGIFINPDRGYLIGLDEPESYLHPDMIRSIAKMIKEASKHSQIIVATHSPLLLNAFNLEDILIFQKDKTNNTTVLRGNEAYQGEEQDLLPGQLWLNGEIGGTRW
ncbi:MAG: AAA family ATPase [Bacteroides sp.]|nr:AAA family ATPase [Bacteroides sp.]